MNSYSAALKAGVLLAAGALGAVTTWAETVFAVTEKHELIRFNSERPGQVLDRRALTGLASNEQLVAMDFRVARGVLYALADSGRLYTVDTQGARLIAVAPAAPQAWPVVGQITGLDFNPTVDRIRVVTSSGQNMRLHPDTNAVVDADPGQAGLQLDGALQFAADDANVGRTPMVAGVAYTYNKKDEKITTNYAIDRSLGALLMQGSREGVVPSVSPNTGQLRTVGALGTGALAQAHFDISDVANTALVAAKLTMDAPTHLYQIDLERGRARELGVVGTGELLRGLAIEP